MKIRVRTAIEGPNKRGKYRATLIVDGKRTSASPWVSEAEAFSRLDAVRAEMIAQARKDPGVTLTFNSGSEASA